MDSGQILELVIDDVRSRRKFTWLQAFIKTCAGLMTNYSYGKQYEILKQAANLTEDKLWHPKQFHTTRFISSELRVYEAILRNWTTYYYLQEQSDSIKGLMDGNISTRDRQQLDVQQQSSNKDVDKIKVT